MRVDDGLEIQTQRSGHNWLAKTSKEGENKKPDNLLLSTPISFRSDSELENGLCGILLTWPSLHPHDFATIALKKIYKVQICFVEY